MKDVGDRKQSLLLFDIDGTLAHSGQPILESIADVLRELKKKYPNYLFGMLGGGQLEKIREQIYSITDCVDYIFAENGLVSEIDDGKIISHNLREVWNDSHLTKIVNALLEYTFQINDLPVKTGKFIDLRQGLIYYCPMGHACTFEDRQKFKALDSNGEYRIQMIHDLRNKYPIFNDAEITLGGELGLSISPLGWDKSFVGQMIDLSKFENVYFFGDKMDPYGADEAVKKLELIKCYPVKSIEMTEDLLKSLFF